MTNLESKIITLENKHKDDYSYVFVRENNAYIINLNKKIHCTNNHIFRLDVKKNGIIIDAIMQYNFAPQYLNDIGYAPFSIRTGQIPIPFKNNTDIFEYSCEHWIKKSIMRKLLS